jgi:hypothetical protein
VQAAGNSFIPDGAQRRTASRAFCAVGGKLFGDVGHEIDRDAELMGHRFLFPRKFANSFALIADGSGYRYRATKDSLRRGFVDPTAFRLAKAHCGREQRCEQENFECDSHSIVFGVPGVA